ncbi:Protein of unknown function DUF4112 [Penicillium citrinum]|uniref:Uncharacterized protein n=1 Tax=Penicillium citrinum TaxID=5077 RepID=A0A9W9PD46_PENCI|nr:Protein of unknown function DUF4112 [Penicillium citrinum]KAJ5241842.1 Protein of unknown function DUF4112 [Penicillium citrinum]
MTEGTADPVDHSLPEEWDRQESGIVENSPPEYREQRPGSRHGNDDAGPPTRPSPARHPRSNRGFGRWFGGASHPEER